MVYLFESQNINITKDLGIFLSQDSSFTEHFKPYSLLCKRLSGWIWFSIQKEGVFSTIVFIPIISILHDWICLSTMESHHKKDILLIESI